MRCKKILGIVYILFVISVLLVIFFTKPSENTNTLDFQDTVYIKKAVIIQKTEDRYRYFHIDMPIIINVNEPFEMDIDLSKVDNLRYKTFSIYSSYMDFSCHIDEKLIYIQKSSKSKLIRSSGGSISYVINFPLDIKDPTLKIKFTPTLKYMDKYVLNPLNIGYRANFIAPVFVHYDLFSIFVTIVFSIVGILFLISSIIFYKDKKTAKKYINMTLIIFLIIIYLFTGYRSINYMFSEYRLLIYFLEYMSLTIMPYPVLRLFENAIDEKYIKISFVLINIIMINYISQIYLTLNKIIEFKEMVFITFIISIIVIILQGILLYLSKENKNEKKELFIFIVPIVLIFIISFAIYIIAGQFEINSILLFAVVIFMFLQLYYAIKYHIHLMNENKKYKKYKNLIKKDALTSLGSRYAFEEYMIYIDKSNIDATIISADLNNLKKINDNLGHNYGDIAIKEAGMFLKSNIKNSKVYRTGGDEYVVICEYIIPEYEFEKIQKLDFYIENVSDKIDVSLSMGMCYYNSNGEKSIYDAFVVADTKMYENKNKYKLEKNINNNISLNQKTTQ